MLLLATPPAFFARLRALSGAVRHRRLRLGQLPAPRPTEARGPLGPHARPALIQFGISIYGGYFGGGIGFLMLAALTLAGLAVRAGGRDQERAGRR